MKKLILATIAALFMVGVAHAERYVMVTHT